MRQIVPFEKNISFNNIYEITSIAMEHNLKMENDDSIVGVFNISGKYKKSNIDFEDKSFEENINFDITLDNKYDSSKIKIDIDNFYYEILDNKYLKVHIDVLLDNLEYKEERCIEEEKKEEASYNEDNIIETIIMPDEKKEVIVDIKNDEIKKEEEIKEIKKEEEVTDSIKNNLTNKEEIYVTYKVHIIRENENINNLIEKYNVTKEELEKYNELNDIKQGSKVIIPINYES